jgi:hypothetical protein
VAKYLITKICAGRLKSSVRWVVAPTALPRFFASALASSGRVFVDALRGRFYVNQVEPSQGGWLMKTTINNAQYNYAKPDSLAVGISTKI